MSDPCRMSMAGAACAEGANPRNAGKCFRCHSPLPEAPRAIRRNLDRERELTREAARGYCDSTQLIDHAEIRAYKLSGQYVSDPQLIKPGRDRLLDAREEAADARNHLVFWLQENAGDDRSQGVFEAMRLFLLAYDRLCRLED